MSGTFNAKVLGDGFLAAARAAIYTVPAATVAYVKQLYLFNENAATQTVELWLNTNGTARKWKRLSLPQNYSADILEEGESIQLQAGDTVEAATTTAAAVPFTITGVEET
jgi:hypothetical protein